MLCKALCRVSNVSRFDRLARVQALLSGGARKLLATPQQMMWVRVAARNVPETTLPKPFRVLMIFHAASRRMFHCSITFQVQFVLIAIKPVGRQES